MPPPAKKSTRSRQDCLGRRWRRVLPRGNSSSSATKVVLAPAAPIRTFLHQAPTTNLSPCQRQAIIKLSACPSALFVFIYQAKPLKASPGRWQPSRGPSPCVAAGGAQTDPDPAAQTPKGHPKVIPGIIWGAGDPGAGPRGLLQRGAEMGSDTPGLRGLVRGGRFFFFSPRNARQGAGPGSHHAPRLPFLPFSASFRLRGHL